MKWCTYRLTGRPDERVGVVDDDGQVHGLAAGTTLLGLLERDELVSAGAVALARPTEIVTVDEVELLPPLRRAPSFRDFLAFEEHLLNSARAMGVEVPEAWYRSPAFYFSNPGAFLGPYEPIRRPHGVAGLDYELEVAAVVGRRGSNLTIEQAGAHIAGYIVLCDWSARDVQKVEIPLTMGPFKSKDFGSSLGGFLVTPDEIDPDNTTAPSLKMTADVNGVRYSEGNLADLHWTFAEMIAEASRNTTIHPGDLMGSGTVSTGCILELAIVHGAERYPYLQPGDRITLTVDGLGTIDTTVV